MNRDRPKKRAAIGLAISSLAGIALLVLLLLITLSIASNYTKPFENLEPGIFVSGDTKNYEIKGTTAEELRAQIDRLGPKGYDSRTSCQMKWKYSFVKGENDCSIGPIRIDTTITTTFPEWKPLPDTPDELRGKWNVYLMILQSHEEKHKEIATQASHEIHESLQSLPAFPTCKELDENANSRAETLFKSMEQEQMEFDRITDHGRAQGAVFP